ncbi:MAG: WecB/TagA/CpsF family glycosyltransferase [Defluviitaleaceae bacterium]|nr:WecB/TagA/CpsF family glycosyltransferase [Defluviitaleaceae bacterium]
MKTNILGINFHTVDQKEALNQLRIFLREDKNHMLFTPNPEMVMKARDNAEFAKILNSGDLVVADGIGIVIASRFNGTKLKERVAGCDLIQKLFENINHELSVYLLGAKKGVCEIAKQNIESKYKNVKVIGFHHGYFKKENEPDIINEIRQLKPDVLLVGLGMYRQEKWIYDNKDILPVKISAGIGGSIDVFAGEVKRAPQIYQKLGLEWFYRVLKQPSRIIRLGALPKFMFLVICRYFKRKGMKV